MVSIPGDKPSLDERVYRFKCLSLPARPAPTHQETARLVFELHEEMKRYRHLYQDLILSVATVHPGESRHDTAKRYICNAEQQTDTAEAQSDG